MSAICIKKKKKKKKKKNFIFIFYYCLVLVDSLDFRIGFFLLLFILQLSMVLYYVLAFI